MANELKPCPFCGSDKVRLQYIRDGQTTLCQSCGANGPSKFLGKDGPRGVIERAVTSWNTRPATAATDTGLVTVGHQYKLGDAWFLSDAPNVMRKAGYELREVVTRENAEAVIANAEEEKAKAIREAGKHFAKTCMMAEEICNLKEARSQAEAIIAAERNRAEVAEYKLDQAVNTVQPMIIQRAERAEAGNAALTVRVKGVEGRLNTAQKTALALETQLAAAKKALEDIAHPKALTSLSRDKARAALEVKP